MGNAAQCKNIQSAHDVPLKDPKFIYENFNK